jgi:two-component sensor histidine kinase
MHARTGAGSRNTAVYATLIFAVACLACFVVMVTWVLVQGYQDAISRAETRAKAYSQVVSANAALMMEASYQALRRMDASVGDELERPRADMIGDLESAVANLPTGARAWLIDADGNPRLTNTRLNQAFSVGDRDYFKGLKSGEPFRISPLMVSRSAGDKVFAVAKRIERNGRFLGAAVIIIPAEFLAPLRPALELGEQSTVGLIRADGMLVTRSPVPAEATDMRDYVLFTDYLKHSSEGTYNAVSPTDGVERVVAYRVVPGYPLVAIASIGRAEALAPFWNAALTLALFGVPGLIGLGTFALWTVRSQRQLAAALEQNQVLFREIHHRVKNNLQQGLALVNLQPIEQSIKDEIARRFAAMAAVHEHMYRADQYLTVLASAFLPQLVEGVQQSFARPVEVTLDVAPALIDREKALAVALIVNEVVGNAIKHAFGNDKPGRISLRLEPVGDDRARLTIADDGKGFDVAAKHIGMGNKLVATLSRQLGAEASYDTTAGTTFTLVFEVEGFDSAAATKAHEAD